MRRGAVAVAGIVALTLPLGACATIAEVSPLVHAGCPADIRIQTDDLPNADWGFLYSLLDEDAVSIRFIGREVSGPLMIDGEDTGIRLTILSGDPVDGTSASVELHEDESLLLGAVDSDVALLNVVQYPTVAIFAPTARDTRIVYWNAETYPGVRNIEALGDTLAPDGLTLAPIVGVPGDPFRDYMVGRGTLGPDQVHPDGSPSVESYLAGGGISAQSGDRLVDPHLLDLLEDAPPIEFQLVDDAGYPRDRLLSARPQTIVRHADCFRVLVPVLQQALVDYLGDPDSTNELLVDVAAQFGHPELDAALIADAHEILADRRFVTNGSDGAVGDIDYGRVRDLRADLASSWRQLELDFPQVEVEDVVTNEFVDRSIGL